MRIHSRGGISNTRALSEYLENIFENKLSIDKSSISNKWTIAEELAQQTWPVVLCQIRQPIKSYASKSLLTHWGRVTHICVGNLCHHLFKQWLVAWPVPNHYLNQSKFVHFLSRKYIWKCRLENGGNFVSALMFNQHGFHHDFIGNPFI